MSSQSSSQSTLVSANSLEIGYKDRHKVHSIAKNINFEVQTGELVAIIGVNGSGKSTLLKSLSGQLNTLKGKININQTSLSQIDHKELGTLLSLVLTNEPVSKQLSVLEMVALGRHPYTNWLGHLTTQDHKIIENALVQVDLFQKKDKICDALSDGQFQKVLIARALAQDTPLILMDEPTTHLDMFHKVYVLKLLKSIIKNSSKSILFASHEINLALQLCDKIILINHEKVECGTPSELVSKGAFNTLFPEDYITFDEDSRTFRMKVEKD
ncbi:ABC transporter ATP-binding protein [Psychroflexus tropicus]|uniref:ABC transporter ATP-binding protein n=1 Tax=Psychroflexus tropicus TaxID=197345 RepID=UPI00036EC6B7|nr:ABC transporter ATP-binding protein [Psychroflexus tropicus]